MSMDLWPTYGHAIHVTIEQWPQSRVPVLVLQRERVLARRRLALGQLPRQALLLQVLVALLMPMDRALPGSWKLGPYHQ